MGNRDLARARKVVKACVETLEGRQLLAGYGELISVESQTYSSAGGAAWLPNGGYVTAWTTGIASYYQGSLRIYSSSGAEQTAQAIAPPQVLAGPIGVAADGHFVAAYSSIASASVSGLWVRVFGANGTPSGDPIPVASDGYGGVVAVAPDGRFAVAYTRSVPGYYAYGTFVRRFDPNGVPVGSEITVGTYTTSGSPYTPAIGMEPNGKMTFAWYGYGVGIRVRQMNWDGTFVGNEFGAASGNTGDIWNPRLGVDASGRFAVSWINPNQGIGLRMFGADQQPLGPEVYMPDSVTGSYDLAVAPDGRGVVMWARGDARGQRFDLSGSLVGDVLPILPPGAGVPNYPVLAVSNSGQVLCMWRSGDSAFGGPVQGVTYGPGLPPTGVELSNASVDENAAGVLVGKLTTTDPDAGDTFTYTLSGGHAGLFAIVGDELRTAQPLDADTMPSITIQVQAHDSSGWTFTRLVTITANNINEAPTSMSLSGGGQVAESQPAGAAVGTLLGYDPDAGDTFSFSLVSGEGDGGNGSFQIVGNELRTAGPLNYEQYSSYPIRVRVTDGEGLWFERAMAVAVSDANEAPTEVTLSDSLVQAERPVGRVVGTLSGSDPDAGNVLTYSLVDGEGATDNGLFQIVGTELRANAVLSYPHGPLSIRVRATDAGGLSGESVLALTVVEFNDPPTATFSGGAAVMSSGSARVAFVNVQDVPADVAAGFLYSYDFDGDGTYDVVNSTSASVDVPGGYLSTFGARTMRGKVTDQRGASSEYTAQVMVSPPMEWWPLYAGLGGSSRRFAAGATIDIATEYRADVGGGLVQHEGQQGSQTEYSDSHVIKVGTTWYLTSETIPPENGDAGRTITFSSPVPIWDENIARGSKLRWSEISAPVVPLNDPVLTYTGLATMSGTLSKVRFGKVLLNNGMRFDNAMLVKQTSVLSAPALFRGSSLQIIKTVITQRWYVQGIGQVKSAQISKVVVRQGSRSGTVGTAARWEELSEKPQWAEFTALEGGTLHVSGSEIGDRIMLSVSGTDVLVSRNGVYSRTPLASVQKVVITGGEGNDVVDARGVALPVEVEGGAGNDRLYGGAAGDMLDGGDGDDRMYGYSGSDVLVGGGGNDRIYGGNENDSLSGGAGVDLLQGQNGDDWIDGRDGLLGERISGGAGVDTAYVDAGERAGAVETREEGEGVMVITGSLLVVENPPSVGLAGTGYTALEPLGGWTTSSGTLTLNNSGTLTQGSVITTGSVTTVMDLAWTSGSAGATAILSYMPDPAVVGTEIRGSVTLTNGAVLTLGEGLKMVFEEGGWVIVEDVVGVGAEG